MTTREHTRAVTVGGVPIGGGNPIVIQSMTNTDTRNVSATVAQINRLAEAGCEIVRVAVPNMEAAEAISVIKKAITLPLVVDIHFDYRLALAAIKNGADKLRINPGNIGGFEKLKLVAESAKAAGIPIRVGVNGGSLEKELLAQYGLTAHSLCESALRSVKMLEDCGFYDIVVSAKASDVAMTIDTHRLLAEQIPYPLHIGVTEAGTPYRGTIHSSVAIGALLHQGIGDTVRVSLTGDPVEEIRCAKEILQALRLRRFGATVVSCPTCGRTQIDLLTLAAKVEAYCETLPVPLTIAVMGCVVNGPGEAREADFGIAGGNGKGVLFQKGAVIRTVPEHELADALINAIQSSLSTGGKKI